MKNMLSICKENFPILGLLFVLILTMNTNAVSYPYINAGTVTDENGNAPTFDCNSLYAAPTSVGNGGGSGTTNWIYKLNLNNNGNYIGNTKILRSTSRLSGNDGGYVNTIALGRAGGDGNNPLTMFGWRYDGIWQNQGKPIYGFDSGSKTAKLVNPNFEYKVWLRGGEMEQKTGYLYMEGNDDKHLEERMDDFKFVIYDPVTNYVKKYATGFRPVTSYDALPSSGTQIESDMAIDAEGNAYLLVSTSDTKATLIKVNVPFGDQNLNYAGDHRACAGNKQGCTSPWTYHKMFDIEGKGLRNVWGMAFLNGMLYLGLSNQEIIEVNPLNYNYRVLGKVGFAIYDLATCQTATIIRGKVFHDTDGKGEITGLESGVDNILVQIYDQNGRLQGERLTAGGEYSFMVPLNRDGTPTTYYIRLKQPKINGVNVHQTWASGGIYSWNGGGGRKGRNFVVPQCTNKIVEKPVIKGPQGRYSGDVIDYYGTLCDGARSDKIDGSDNNINIANYYTVVAFTTDMEVPHADFALGAIDRSDAPPSFSEAYHSIQRDKLFLGDGISADTASKVSSDANKDDFDDGVFVEVNNRWIPLQSAVNSDKLSMGKSYTFRVKVSGNNASNGYLSAWTNLNSGGLSNYFSTQIAKDFRDGKNGDIDGMENGYITFDYTVPTAKGLSGKLNIFFRFRFSLLSDVDAVSTSVYSGSQWWNKYPWVVDGEVEDYMCELNPLIINPINTFNVVNDNLKLSKNDINASAHHTDNALYTQVSGQQFGVKLVALSDKKLGGNIKLVSWSDYTNDSVTASVNLIDADTKIDAQTYDGHNDKMQYCKKAAPIAFGPQNINIKRPNYAIDSMIYQLNISTNVSVKNARFQIVWRLSGSNETKYDCSFDNFAIRPAGFSVLDANGQDNSNLTIIGGMDSIYKMRAYDIKNGTAYMYNQTVNTISYNGTFNIPTQNSCDSNKINTNLTGNLIIKNIGNFSGGASNISLFYNNVGNINVIIKDSVWTAVDSNGECIKDSSTNIHDASKLVGCDIASKNLTLNFTLDHFYSHLSLHNGGNGFTYLSNNDSMAALFDYYITAMLHDNSTASNYHQNCFAKDTTLGIELASNNLKDWNNDAHRKKAGLLAQNRIQFWSENSSVQNGGKGSFKTNQTDFINGKADNLKFKFNFKREVSKAENPFMVKKGDFNITSITDGSTNKTSYQSNIEGEDINFYYGRVYAANYLGSSPINATIKYELYCLGCNKTTYNVPFNTINIDDSRWSGNKNHNNFVVEGNVSQFSSIGKTSFNMDLNETSSTTITNGKETIKLNNKAGYTPYKDVIVMKPSEWLINDFRNDNATNVTFDIKFIGTAGKWAGEGSAKKNGSNKTVGRVMDIETSNRSRMKVDW